MSLELTAPFAVVSPSKKLTGTRASPGADGPSVTPFSTTEHRDAFGTPVRLIVTSSPDVLVLMTLPHDVLTPVKVTGTANVTTNW
jgi:hypothetical protein